MINLELYEIKEYSDHHSNYVITLSALLNGKNKSYVELPRDIDQYMLEQLVSEQLGGFLLILTGAGKIIFISHTVEQLLGHLQVKSTYILYTYIIDESFNNYCLRIELGFNFS